MQDRLIDIIFVVERIKLRFRDKLHLSEIDMLMLIELAKDVCSGEKSYMGRVIGITGSPYATAYKRMRHLMNIGLVEAASDHENRQVRLTERGAITMNQFLMASGRGNHNE